MLIRTKRFARIHWVELSDIPKNMIFDEKHLKEINKKLEKMEDVKYGDFISVMNCSQYRNDGLFIFDGEKVVQLESKPDEYGNIPSNFQVLVPNPDTKKVIPPRYWHGVGKSYFPKNHAKCLDQKNFDNFKPYKRFMCHNAIAWFDTTPYKRELIKNLTGKENMWTWCTNNFDDKKIYILFARERNAYSNGGFTVTKLDKRDILSIIKRMGVYPFSCLLSSFHDDLKMTDWNNDLTRLDNILFCDAESERWETGTR